MKRVFSTLLTLAAMLLMFASNPAAQGLEKPVDFYLGVGASIPTGDLADGWNIGFHATGRAGFSVAPKLELLVGADFHIFGLDNQVTNIEGGSLSSINLSGDLKIDLGTPDMSASPYLLGGGGLAIWSIGDITIPGFGVVRSDSESDFFIEAGVGVVLNHLFLQVKYVNIFSKGSSISYIPLTVGVKF
ncbi:MAG: outer membrane beta-barrel protein [candidate division Zixibacteria bacterium]|nr:outer membrane beta-barrel protein [candidate division Zixibacteria bacterium]